MDTVKSSRRDCLCLNGEWDFMPYLDREAADELPDPIVYEEEKVCVPSSWRGFDDKFHIPEYDFAPMDVFAYPKHWAKAEAGLLHRTFRVPEEWKGKKIVLRCDGVFQKSVIWLDRIKAGTFSEAFLPICLDITPLVRYGEEQELYVQCGPFDTVEIPSGARKTTGLGGNWFGRFARGIWQDIYLSALPFARVEDVEITTSVRNGIIEGRILVENEADTPLCGTLAARVSEWKSGRVLWEAEQDIVLNPLSEKEIYYKRPWGDAVYWDTENPFLYCWETKLTAADGLYDAHTVRFGFREFWTEGDLFYLNGIPIKLRGDSWHFQGAVQQTKAYAENWFSICRESGVNSVRLHAEPHPAYYLDAADEMGMLIVDETAIYGSGKAMDASSPVFLDNCRRHVQELVKRDRNHPSVVIWSLENEMRWVEGRDVYKKHIPGLMALMHAADHAGRPISLDGDNRLISGEHTEIASLHYNIDGTISQWDHSTPLTIGEHGGHWYLCPQNASMYEGMGVYTDSEVCCHAVALKEKLFLEYARRMDVTGISSFNIAHYFAVSMPDRDIPLPPVDREGRWGVYPKLIRKYSMTIGNGILEKYGYPRYKPNPAYPLIAEAMRPVTAILREYDQAFYGGRAFIRTFDIYHDVQSRESLRLEVECVQEKRSVCRTAFCLDMDPAGHEVRTVEVLPCLCGGDEPETMILSWRLFAGEKMVEKKEKSYKIFPAFRGADKRMSTAFLYVGINGSEYRLLERQFGNVTLWVEQEQMPDGALIIIGSHQTDRFEWLEERMDGWIRDGHPILCLAQHAFAYGDLELERRMYLGAYEGCRSHPLLTGVDRNAFFYWNGEISEAGPVPDFLWAYRKAEAGNIRYPLECGCGDFGDGGDLWSALVEYRFDESSMLLCQLELEQYYEKVPYAAQLLERMADYLLMRQEEIRQKERKVLYVGCEEGSSLPGLLDETKAAWKMLFKDGIQTEKLPERGCLLADAAWIKGRETWLSQWAAGGGHLLIQGVMPGMEESIALLAGAEIEILPETVWQFETLGGDFLRDISIADCYGMDLVHMCPRKVENRKLCEYTVQSGEGSMLARRTAKTVWEDTFVKKHSAEYCRRSLVEINRRKEETRGGCAWQFDLGRGRILISQIAADGGYGKSVRLYTGILDREHISFAKKSFRTEAAFRAREEMRQAVNEWMVLPCEPWQDLEAMRRYYTDPEYSLNNLGEGLYGWMKKAEKSRSAGGWVFVDQWIGCPLFMTCFVCTEVKTEVRLCLNASRSARVYCNGEPAGDTVWLKPGSNVFCVEAEPGKEPFRMRLRLTDGGGHALAGRLWYRLTVDEIDPK